MNFKRYLLGIFFLSLSAPICSHAETPSIKERQDPFYIGPSASLTFTNYVSTGYFDESAVFQGDYGWETGIAAQIIVPATLMHHYPGTPDDYTPRLGGGGYSHVRADADFRLWGDPYDYFGFGTGIGFPWQSTQVQSQSINASWLLALDLMGRMDWGWGAFTLQIADQSTFLDKSSIADQFFDESNLVSSDLVVYFYPTSWLAPYVGWSESYPTVNTRSGTAYFIISETHNSRTRDFLFGAQWAPTHVPCLLTTEFDYYPLASGLNDAEYSGTLGVRWLF